MEEFQIIQPSSLLAPYVKQYWLLKTDNLMQQQRIIPDGSTGLVFHRGSNLFSLSKATSQPQAFISGQLVGYTDLQPTGKLDMISITFHPHGAKAFFNTPVDELHGKDVSLADLHDHDLTELQDRLMNTTDTTGSVRLIENFLQKRLHISKAYNYERLSAVIQSINQGQTDIKKLADTSCLSYKQFKRVFMEYIGANPKDFLRIVRFQRALHVLQTQPHLSLTALAYTCGYYDQSHLIKDFRVFSGYTPGEYISIYTPYSDYFS